MFRSFRWPIVVILSSYAILASILSTQFKRGFKRRSRFIKQTVSEKSSEIGVWAFVVWDRGTVGQSDRPHVFERS